MDLRTLSQIQERINKAGIKDVGVSLVLGRIIITGKDPQLVAQIQAKVDRGEIDTREQAEKTPAEIYDELIAKLGQAALFRTIAIAAIREAMKHPDSPIWQVVDRMKPLEVPL